MLLLSHPSALLAYTLCVSGLVNGSPTMSRRDGNNPLANNLSPDYGPVGACTDPNDYSTQEKRADIWFHSHGGELAEYYLRNEGTEKHDTVDWVQDIFKLLFPNSDPAQMSCTGSETSCGVGTLDCKKDFDNRDYLERLDWLKGNLTNDLPILVDDFQVDKETDKELNFFAILAGALGMAAGATAANPAISGPLGALGGISAIIANTKPPNQDSAFEKMGKVKADLAKITSATCEQAYKAITQIQDAIHGREGTSEDMLPAEMLHEDDFSAEYQHKIPKVMGAGAWLLEHPDQNLRADFKEVGNRMMQTLAIHLMRVFNQAYLFIFTDSSADKCVGGSAVWDSDANLCYSFGSIAKHDVFGNELQTYSIQGNNDFAKPLWDKYGADRLITYRNIIDCWLNNDSKIGVPTLSATSPGTDIKRCFFSIEVKKGSLDNAANTVWINLVPEEEFPNFSGEDKINNGGYPAACKYRTWEGTNNCRQWPVAYNMD
ncbi:hypothetical protein BCR34DRAFT_588762 [Clohesyomyces aquaticus]|uniref:Uncharacterized protein n=1 Tax=Clohesyomyces aquaticus TaxID=1231657 RepID=A0A1Y1ZJF8_9PLEO|nr:hypothetical protein BCR34DRAFT_588762 [Clohesyomyces aquaticus]